MTGKTMAESRTTIAQVMNPQDANVAGNVHGGSIMKLIDSAAGVVAAKHTRTNVVTASVDRLDFHHPIYIGELVTLRANLNMVGRTSMEVGVRVEAENIRTGEIKHSVSAYLTFVALDDEGRPMAVPALIAETDEDKRRNRDAIARRDQRLKECRRDF
jgi:uncharacterized protein (TIGR00369 family)